MDGTRLVAVLSLEKAWARLSANPEYQKCITAYFKAPTFYIGCSGLYAGTSAASGRRAVYCDPECVARLSRDLAAKCGNDLAPEAKIPPNDPPAELVEDVQSLSLTNEADVKALFKEFKRAARFQKQGRQLAAAQALLLKARRWTAPFSWSPVGASQEIQQLRYPSTENGEDTSKSGLVGAESGATNCGSDSNSMSAVLSPGPSRCNGAGGRSSGSAGPAAGSTSGISGGAGDQSPTRAVLRFQSLQGLASEDKNEACLGACPGTTEDMRHLAPAAGPFPAAPAPTASSGPFLLPSAAALSGAGLSLRKLHAVVAGSDPWDTPGCPTLLPPGNASVNDSSSCPSLGASSAPTPSWPPTTPRSTLPLRQRNTGTTIPATPANGRPSPFSYGAEDRSAGDCGPGELVVCCCVDLEWWERDSSRVTEIGWTMWDNLTRRLVSRHHIVAEHEALINRIYVPDHKHEFLFGPSATGSLAQGAAALQADLDHYGERLWREWCAGAGRQQSPGQAQQKAGVEPQTQGSQGREPAGEQTGGGGEHTQWQPREAPGERVACLAVGTEPEGGPSAAAAAAGASAAACGDGRGGAAARGPGAASEEPPATPRPAWCCDAAGAEAAPRPTPPPIQVVVVGHGLSQDLKALSTLLGVSLPVGAAVLDTSDLAWAALGGCVGQERMAMSLRVLLKTLGIPATKLHNGGNDARYTMEAMLFLATMDPSSNYR